MRASSRPLAKARSGAGEGLRLRGRGRLLAAGHLLAVEGEEVDLLEVERRVAAVAGHVADDPADVREDEPRALDHQERVQLVLRHVLDEEETGVVEFEDEDPSVHSDFESAMRKAGAACRMGSYHPGCTEKPPAKAAS